MANVTISKPEGERGSSMTTKTETMGDVNSITLVGTLAVDGEVKEFDSGTRLIRFLLTVKVEHPRRRVDVIPVTLWDPPEGMVRMPGKKGDRLAVTGSIQRRYWESPDGRRSRVEVVAETVEFEDSEGR